jgi:hypothetical protein
MRAAAHVLAAFLLIVLTGALWRVVPADVVAPQVGLLVALYLGASVRGQVWEATAAALAVGYLHDIVDGGPRGLFAFVLGAVCLLARVATARLLVRGTVFIMVFTWSGAAVAVVLTWVLRAALGGAVRVVDELPAALGSTVVTALAAPLVFRIGRVIDARFARTQREREALREGYLT